MSKEESVPIRTFMTGRLEEIDISDSVSSVNNLEQSPSPQPHFSPMSPFKMNSPALLSKKSGSTKGIPFLDGHNVLKNIALGSPTPSQLSMRSMVSNENKKRSQSILCNALTPDYMSVFMR